MEFPGMLYKPTDEGSGLLWDGQWFETLVVADADELEIALSDGWFDGSTGPVEPEEEPDD